MCVVAMVFQSVVITLTPIALSVYLSLYTGVQGMQGELWYVMILSSHFQSCQRENEWDYLFKYVNRDLVFRVD